MTTPMVDPDSLSQTRCPGLVVGDSLSGTRCRGWARRIARPRPSADRVRSVPHRDSRAHEASAESSAASGSSSTARRMGIPFSIWRPRATPREGQFLGCRGQLGYLIFSAGLEELLQCGPERSDFVGCYGRRQRDSDPCPRIQTPGRSCLGRRAKLRTRPASWRHSRASSVASLSVR
jgi:hypothetical protein